MSTSTARLQLTKPTGSESMASGATQLSDAWGKIDAAIGVKKVATAGSVASPFVGELIKETSTGKSLVYNTPNWDNFYDPNDGKGNSQYPPNTGPVADEIGPTEWLIFQWNVNVEAGRKYLVNYSLSLASVQAGGGTTNYKGYMRINYRWATGADVDLYSSTVAHSKAVWISGANSSKSKNVRGSFEFFPNVTGVVSLGQFGQILSGVDLFVDFNQSGANSSVYLTDWGV